MLAATAIHIRAIVVDQSLVNFSTFEPLRIAPTSLSGIDLAEERREFA
jgi:hypothetical protein